VLFTEDILCARPFNFLADLIVGTNIILNKNDVDILCEGNRMEISLYNTLTAGVLSSKKVTVRLSQIRDLAHNIMNGQVEWTFKFAKNFDAASQLDAQEVEVRDVELSAEWDPDFTDTQSIAYQTLFDGLIDEIANILGLDSSRLSLGVVKEVNSKTVVSVTVLPARRRRSSAEGVEQDDTPLHLAYVLQTRLRQPSVVNDTTKYPYLSGLDMAGNQDLKLNIEWAQLYPPLPELPRQPKAVQPSHVAVAPLSWSLVWVKAAILMVVVLRAVLWYRAQQNTKE
jgi:hypothetical protein